MDTPQATARIAGHPLHPLLVTIPIGCWVLALLTDIAYWRGGWAMWAYASTWLIGAAIVSALIAALAGFADFFGDRRIREIRRAWWHMLGNLTAVGVAVVNFIVHMRDGAAAVIPTGLLLSAVTVAILLFTGWQGGELVFRHGVAVHPRSDTP
jgi:uncharacterized membrane protein